MPKRKTGVSSRVLECAKEDFLANGFLNTSIRSIAEKADTSPRAIYTRFPDKEGLFSALVDATASEFIERVKKMSDGFWRNTQDHTTTVNDIPPDPMLSYIQLMDYAYDHFDEFVLILKHSDGTPYSDFIERIALMNYQNVEAHHKEDYVLPNYEPNAALAHVLARSFYTGFFEPLLHNMPREEAHYYVKRLYEFFRNGIQNM